MEKEDSREKSFWLGTRDYIHGRPLQADTEQYLNIKASHIRES
jgi:hypothetical protein